MNEVLEKKETLQIEPQFRSIEIRQDSIDQEKRTITLSFSSEKPVERWWGTEILDHSPDSVNLERLQGKAPLLLDHSRGVQIGVIEKAWIGEDRRGYAVVRFSKSERAEEIFQDVLDKIRTLVSVGYMIHEMVLEKSGDDGDTYRVTNWEPLEISIVSVPADITVGIGRDEKTNPVNVLKRKEGNMPEKEVKETVTTPTVDIEKEKARIRDQEAKRVREIFEMGKNFDMEEEARQAVLEGTTADEFRKLILEKIDRQQHVASKVSTVGMTEKEVQEYSFMRMIRAMLKHGDNWRQAAGYEAELSDEVAKRMGKDPQGAFVPRDVIFQKEVVRELTATSASALVGTDHLGGSFIELLRNRAVVFNLGARILSGLVGDVEIPKQSGAATAYWVGDSSDITPSDQTFGTVSLAPKTVGAATLFSRKLLLQSDPSIEALVLDDLARVLALAIDQAALNGDGASNNPTGILNTSGIGSVAGTSLGWSGIVELESDVAEANADIGTMYYVMRAAMRGLLKTREKASNTAKFLMDDNGMVNGYPSAITNQMPAATILFGAFNQLLIGMWGALDVLVDKYTSAADGGTYIWVYQDVDVAVRHAAAFSAATSIT